MKQVWLFDQDTAADDCLFPRCPDGPALTAGMGGNRPIHAINMEEHKLGLTAMLFSVSSIISGAVMYWIVDAQASGFRFDSTAIILIIAGLVGFVLSALACAISPRRISDEHIFDNQAAGPPVVNTTMTEEGC